MSGPRVEGSTDTASGVSRGGKWQEGGTKERRNRKIFTAVLQQLLPLGKLAGCLLTFERDNTGRCGNYSRTSPALESPEPTQLFISLSLAFYTSPRDTNHYFLPSVLTSPPQRLTAYTWIYVYEKKYLFIIFFLTVFYSI